MTKSRKRLSTKAKLIGIAIIAIAVILLIAFLPGAINSGKKGTTLSVVSLKQAVNISKLSTAEFAYQGITEKLNDQGKAEYHISYKTTVTSGIDMESIEFKIDHEKRTVTPVLPEVSVYDPVIDETSIDYLPKSANIDLREVIELCKQDALSEIEQAPVLKETATNNMRSTIEALLIPLLESNGYTIDWGDENASSDQDNAGEALNQNGLEGGNNEDDQ